MIKINENFNNLQGNYLFAEVDKRVKEYKGRHPDKKVLRLGIGDVTEPLAPSILNGLKEGVEDMGRKETFKGYSPYEGYAFLREIISKSDFKSRGVSISPDEIYVSTGAKEDTANIQELFSADARLAITDPVYPVYIDSNVMAGRSGKINNGRYEKITYLSCTIDNNFIPALPDKDVDLIYLCFPNNPTGQVATRDILRKWVGYAREHKSLILFDAAYEAFIKDKDIPHSIFEIEGSREVAIEFRSLSKTAGFTGTRCSYTIIPDELKLADASGNLHHTGKLWLRRQSTKFNGTAYLIQKGAYYAFTPEGKLETGETINYYLGNAKIIADGIKSLGLDYSGGINSPYIWFKVPEEFDSWGFFDHLLNECQVIGTPGAGFGKCGEGYMRLSSFGSRDDITEAVQRIKGHI